MAVKSVAPVINISTMAFYSILVDNAGAGITYFGFAKPGSETSASAWRILRENASGNPVTYLYANGSENFANIWDNRAGYNYV